MPEDLDFILIGCDGIWERKTNEEMADWIYKKISKGKYNSNLENICRDLFLDECLSPDYQQTSKLTWIDY